LIESFFELCITADMLHLLQLFYLLLASFSMAVSLSRLTPQRLSGQHLTALTPLLLVLLDPQYSFNPTSQLLKRNEN